MASLSDAKRGLVACLISAFTVATCASGHVLEMEEPFDYTAIEERHTSMTDSSMASGVDHFRNSNGVCDDEMGEPLIGDCSLH